MATGSSRREVFTAAGIAATTATCAWFTGPSPLGLLVAAGAGASIGFLVSRRPPRDLVRPDVPSGSDRPAVAEALLAHIPDPVILIDRRAVVLEANTAARTLLPAMKLRHPLAFSLRDPDILDGIEEVLRTGASLKIPYAPRVPTERAFEVQIGALPMPVETSGRGTASQPNLVLFLRDLTSARRLETMRVDFVANASHELRTPLASLLGFIETLQGPARDDAPARVRFLAIMRSQAQRMTRLIDDLLSLSRIELREHVAPTQLIDLGQIARQMVDAQSPLAAERGVDVRYGGAEGCFPVFGERDELMRVAENLIENAVKYGGVTVTVSVARRHAAGRAVPQIELSVTDDGPGIAPEHLPRLTERFYRVDAASSRQQGGTGLGLAIVKHSLNRHRGRLSIESAVGTGTIVRASMPEAEASR